MLDPASHRITVDGLVGAPLSIGLAELRYRLPRRELVATLQCAGNRRDELMALAPVPDEVPWGAQAVSTARWSGVSLADLMRLAGVGAEAQHVGFEGLDRVERAGSTFGFGGSISIERAMAGDVLLAFEMNGQPLPQEHGAPVRVIVPGYIGARSVKWLSRVEARATRSENHFEAHAYKLFPPAATAASADWEGTLPIQEMQLGSVICRPSAGAVTSPGATQVVGYATAGGERRIARVEVSPDGGESWLPAELIDAPAPGTWVRWRASIELPPGSHELVTRATDLEGHAQPADLAAAWNFKGYMNDAWHRVPVRVETA